jgi:hypothetical protein
MSGISWFGASPKVIEDMWEAAAAIAQCMGAKDPAHLALRVLDEGYGPRVDSEWWTTVEVSPTTLDAIYRDLRRAIGDFTWEPEPDSPT